MKFSWSTLTFVSLVLPATASTIEKIPRQTSPAFRLDRALVPESAPTEAPQPRWARYDSHGLFDRAVGKDTCGYLSASISGSSTYYPFTCGNTAATCTNSGSYRGCCSGAACTSTNIYWTGCADATAAICQTGVSSRNTMTLCCTYSSLYPYCITYLWSTTARPGTVYTQYNCDRQTWSGAYFLEADLPSTTSSTTPSTTTRAPSTTPSTTSTTASSSSSSPTPPGETASSGVPIGPVVGGVVGGVGLLAIIGLIAWFIIRKNKKDKNLPPAAPMMTQHTGTTFGGPPGAPSMMQQQNTGASYPSGPPGSNYDPRFSTYSGAVPIQQSHSPNSHGHPSPVHSPVPYTNIAGFGNHPSPPIQEGYAQGGYVGQEGYNNQGGYINQQQTGTSFARTDHTGVSQGGSETYNTPVYHPPGTKDMVSELPHQNKVGTGNNRAELA